MARLKPCIVNGCGSLTRGTRCAQHQSEREAERGTPAERGYDAAHRQKRTKYQRLMDAGQVFYCWRGGGKIDPSNWTLGHCDDDRSVHHGPECPPCDYATAGRHGCPHPSHPGGDPSSGTARGPRGRHLAVQTPES